jgi:hypothetical protein
MSKFLNSKAFKAILHSKVQTCFLLFVFASGGHFFPLLGAIPGGGIGVRSYTQLFLRPRPHFLNPMSKFRGGVLTENFL